MNTPFFNRKRFLVALSLVMGVSGGVYYFLNYCDKVPNLLLEDLNSKKQFGRIDRVTGVAFSQILNGTSHSEKVPIKVGDIFTPGTLFLTPNQSQIQIESAGEWVIAIDQEGEALFEGARTNEKRDEHLAYWFVKKGSFRALPDTGSKNKHWMVLRVPSARLIAEEAEFGVSVNGQGGVRAFVMKGKVTAFWDNGKRKVLALKGIEEL